jgi:hypothetical protein
VLDANSDHGGRFTPAGTPLYLRRKKIGALSTSAIRFSQR